MASMWSLLLPLHLLGLTAPLGSSALTRENFFDRIDLCSGTLPGTSSFPDVSKVSCAMKCSESEACTAFTFIDSSGTCSLHYELDLTSHLCAASSTTSLHFQKKSIDVVCQNGAHTGGSTCKCVNGYIGSQCEQLTSDCKEIISSGYYDDALPGIFIIQPSQATIPIRVFCSPDVEHIILLRFFNVPSFNRSMADYVAGFGDDHSDYWVGLENLHLLTSSTSYTLGVQVSFPAQYQRYYSNFEVKGAGDGYSMTFTSHYDPPTSSVLPMGDCLSPLQNHPFSTYDADNDGNATYNCAETTVEGGGTTTSVATATSWAEFPNLRLACRAVWTNSSGTVGWIFPWRQSMSSCFCSDCEDKLNTEEKHYSIFND
ncbi:angiopoietin-1-like [Pomacea canaliculata]|uniref:angiopoietin-1-like n=1 Tax=Pomacea canaliculata TaxID=400727 RepID=UPI000D73DD98|nr:angiopoietin-1-like [Pomacea canaliculata]